MFLLVTIGRKKAAESLKSVKRQQCYTGLKQNNTYAQWVGQTESQIHFVIIGKGGLRWDTDAVRGG